MNSYIFTIDDRHDFLSEIADAYLMNSIKKDRAAKTLNIGNLIIDAFSDGEFSPNFQHSIRGTRVYLVGSTDTPQNIVKMFLTIDAARRASAREVIAVIPSYGYARQDRKDGKRGTVGAKTMANLLVASGANRIISVDLHADQIEGFFDIPFDHIAGQRIFEQWIVNNFESNNFSDVVLVSPDAGGTKRVDKYWRRLGEKYNVTNAYISKFRSKPNSIDRMELNGTVDGKDAVIIDDMIDTAGTLCKAAELLKEKGARRIYAIATHGILSGKAIENLNGSVIENIIVSNTIKDVSKKSELCTKIEVLSIAEQIARFILAIDLDTSPSDILLS